MLCKLCLVSYISSSVRGLLRLARLVMDIWVVQNLLLRLYKLVRLARLVSFVSTKCQFLSLRRSGREVFAGSWGGASSNLLLCQA